MAPQQLGSNVVISGARALRALPAGLLIRPRSKGDSEGLWRLFSQQQFQRFGTISESFESPKEVQAWMDRNMSASLELVATIDETIVAFASLYPLSGRQSHVGWITLGVHDEFQGRGIGTALLKLVLDTADMLAGLRRIQLNVFTDNERAMALYHAFGFRIEGRHESFAFRDGAYIDAFTMARLIHESSAIPTSGDIVSLVRQLQPLPQKEMQA